jgi:hypothetical protein
VVRSTTTFGLGLLLPLFAGSVIALASCSDSNDTAPSPDAGPDIDADVPDTAPIDTADADAAAPTTPICETLGLKAATFATGPYGTKRGEIAGDFSLALIDGSTWKLQESFSGCESYVFLPDSLPVSDLDNTSIWTKDIDSLVAKSPKNVHYFFVATGSVDANATKNTQAMQARIEAALHKVSQKDAAHWRAHLHVVAGRAGTYGNWVGDVLGGIGRRGFAIDRGQRIRGVGMLADVTRSNADLQAANKWPWEANLAYAAHEAIYMNAQADIAARLAAESAKVVPLFGGEVLSGFAEKDIDLPSAAEIAAFDTLEVEVTMACPNASLIEFGNCGAWDYLAYLFVREGGDDAGTNLELARFITSYHRETHWVVDATPMLARLKAGGSRHFRWEFAPDWNKQPTATTIALRFSNAKKGYAPAQITPLFGGGAFNAHYNDARTPVDVPIPADAKRVELWSLTTGHGADPHQCAEFCNHQHELTVNQKTYLQEFKEAATDDGCVGQAAHGMVPNQGGTWWFGRGGWCPGKQVDPWVVDITKDVTPGQSVTVKYRGLLAGATPPDDGAGNIVLNSYLVVYR